MTLAEMSVALRRYVIAVVIGGPVLAALAAAAFLHDGGMSAGGWVRALLLTVLVAIAYARPLRVAHKFSYDISEVVHVAMIVLFPPWLPGILVGVAGALHLVRRPGWRDAELFNVGQVMMYVTASAVCLELLRQQPEFGPAPAGLPPLGAIAVAAAVLLVVNLSLVAGAIALQTQANFWRLLRGHIRNVAPTYFALVALGIVAALVVRDYPVALAPLILPAGLAQYALEREVRLRAETREALAALVDVVELRDPYTAGHSRRVAESSRILAIWMGLTGEEADLIDSAGRVHDLGKLAMSPALLSKQGPLDDDEWRQVRQHPVHGAAILERFAGYRECSLLVRHHHERWDGAGYPAGMEGDAIPLGSRILAVADAFDAMTSTRAYRPAQGPDTAMRILEQGAGVQWDPRVVAAFVECRRQAATAATSNPAGQPVHA